MCLHKYTYFSVIFCYYKYFCAIFCSCTYLYSLILLYILIYISYIYLYILLILYSLILLHIIPCNIFLYTYSCVKFTRISLCNILLLRIHMYSIFTHSLVQYGKYTGNSAIRKSCNLTLTQQFG